MTALPPNPTPNPNRLTEIEENQLRNLLSRFRDKQPECLIAVLFDTLAFRLNPDSITSFAQRDANQNPVLQIAVARGPECARALADSITVLQKKMMEESEGQEDEG